MESKCRWREWSIPQDRPKSGQTTPIHLHLSPRVCRASGETLPQSYRRTAPHFQVNSQSRHASTHAETTATHRLGGEHLCVEERLVVPGPAVLMQVVDQPDRWLVSSHGRVCATAVHGPRTVRFTVSWGSCVVCVHATPKASRKRGDAKIVPFYSGTSYLVACSLVGASDKQTPAG
jgi:hypothetical protein